ncbi:MAG: hypothetical protein HZA81_02825 [Candidatus Taylorbacteria bacterium]|nr:hypothetical protein [Candidatus Taylorbacteria bacterium]
MAQETYQTVESLWNEEGRGMRAVWSADPMHFRTLTNQTATAHLLLSSTRQKTRGVRAIIFDESEGKKVDYRFDEDSPLAWTDRELATAFDRVRNSKNLATDPDFARECGADVAIRGKFARKGRELVIFCEEMEGDPPKKRAFSILVTDEIAGAVGMLLPKL